LADGDWLTANSWGSMEKQLSFTVRGQRLYGMLHLPQGRGPFPALSFFHGFTGQRMEPHQLFVKTARRLASEGIASLRFDFRGSGESEGEFRDMTVSGEIKDAAASLDFLCGRSEVDKDRLGVLGLSMGGFVASRLASQDRRVKTLVLWAAAARASERFARYVHLTGRNPEKWIRQGEWDFGGNVLRSRFLKELGKMKSHLPRLSHFPGPVLVLHGEADAAVPVSEADAYRKTLRRAEVQVLKGADHTFNRADWETKVIETTVRWLKTHI
jgi:dipeptidyl aminopeptidase/acylaminoacyl peptidase